MDTPPTAQPPAAPAELLLETYYHIGDGGFTVRVERDNQYGYPILTIKHGAWGHGSQIQVFPEPAVLKQLSEFFAIAAQQAFKGAYCHAARAQRPLPMIDASGHGGRLEAAVADQVAAAPDSAVLERAERLAAEPRCADADGPIEGPQG